MATFHSYQIPQVENLEFCVDGNIKYINGTTWKGAKADVEMVNGPIYTQIGSDAGYWTFNGTNQFGYITKLNYGDPSTSPDNGDFPNFTCHLWVRTTFSDPSTSVSVNWSWIDFDRSETFNIYPLGNGTVGFSGRDGINDYFDTSGTIAVNDGNWHCVSVTWDASAAQLKFYVDGELDILRQYSSGGALGTAGQRRWGFVGDGSEATGENGSRNNIYYDGDIGRIVLLKATLTDEEVKREWLYNKTRFGIT